MQSSSQSAQPAISPAIPLLVGMLAISFAPILVRASDAPVSVQGMYRMLFTFLFMLPFGGKQLKTLTAIGRKDWLLLIAAGFFLALHFLLWMASLTYTSIASSTILLALEPVFVMVGAFFVFKDRPSKFAVAGMLVALVGAISIGSGDVGLSQRAFFGDLLSFLGALAVAVNMLIAKQIMRRLPSYLYSLIVFGITAACFVGYNVALGIPMTGYPAKEWLVFALLAVVPTVFGHMIFNWLLKYVKPTTISMTVLAEPVGASLLAMLLFREMVTGFQLFGGLLIIVGLVLYMRAEKQEAAAVAAPADPLQA
ncbi:Permease of the drug/metabolite transporter (DMT) superfamily [Paenibacillus sp. UNC496MF]|uniref:DMT family transporter n=1 Tax=Paenibacillus sp. UNC496MF TaxID=1502753 RepID=UPI0008E7C100|nr:DMT family transporter [Paenibacillus sp. UNC496MF]SFI34033.1 Permease of the drug/metabolite transporter (DMT) superfamily [Paenibacillus sp. UNC496MF]